MTSCRVLLFGTCFSLPLLIGMQPVAAQTAPQTAASTSYDAVHFAGAQPSSAYDMVLLLPGFRLQEGNVELRGYAGAGGNILVDGQRPSSKQDTLEEILKRIPARMVERVDLVRSASAGFDMQGYPIIANVVRKRRGALSGRVELEDAFYGHGYSAPRVAGQVSYGVGDRQLDLTGALYRKIDDEHGFGLRNRTGPDGTPLRIGSYEQPEGADVREASANYRQNLAGGTIRLNGLVKSERMFANIMDHVRVPSVFDASGTERVRTDATELGFTYTRPLGARSQIELIGIRRATDVDGTDTSSDPDGSDVTHDRSQAREAILRAVVRRQGHVLSIETGMEGALNTLDSHSALEEDGVDVPLPAANVRVEEKRAEVFLTTTWRMAPTLNLEAGARYEMSRLRQSGDSALTRSLAYLKPRMLLRWSASRRSEIRLLVERKVGQLDFADFAGSASLTSGTITAGNRDLAPYSLWRAELAWERRVGAGAFVLTARHEAISDVVDRTPVFIGGEVYDAVGNIGNGQRDEVEANVNLPLDPVGLKGVMVRGNALLRASRVTDPSTGERRRISGDSPLEAKLSLTHDLPRAHLRWGANYVWATQTTAYRINEVERDRLSDRVDAFIEYKPTARLTVRIYGKNLTDSAAVRVRDRYAGLRGVVPLSLVERRELNSGRYVGLNIQRSFGQ